VYKYTVCYVDATVAVTNDQFQGLQVGHVARKQREKPVLASLAQLVNNYTELPPMSRPCSTVRVYVCVANSLLVNVQTSVCLCVQLTAVDRT
jgi:hypothetical protein